MSAFQPDIFPRISRELAACGTLAIDRHGAALCGALAKLLGDGNSAEAAARLLAATPAHGLFYCHNCKMRAAPVVCTAQVWLSALPLYGACGLEQQTFAGRVTERREAAALSTVRQAFPRRLCGLRDRTAGGCAAGCFPAHSGTPTAAPCDPPKHCRGEQHAALTDHHVAALAPCRRSSTLN